MLDSAPQHPSNPPSHSESGQKSVLVVEDDPSIAHLIAAILEDAGYRPHVVRDGRRALQVVRELQPAAVTLDLELPGVDGRTVLRRLVAERQGEHLPIVIVSGSTELLTREERRYVARALTKPFDLVELVQAVDEIAAQEAS
jgi:CheY-like chemotaxis protein